jgi:hypothetical protein
MTTTDITIYIKAIQLLNSNTNRLYLKEAENQVYFATAEKASAFQKSVVVAKSKATDKQTDVADANIKELKHCLTRNVKLKLYGYNCCN